MSPNFVPTPSPDSKQGKTLNRDRAIKKSGIRSLTLVTTIATVCLTIVIFSGCSFMKDKTYQLNEAEKKFVEFCKKEGQVDVTLHQVGRTEWIYLTLNEAIFNIKASHPTDNATRKVMPFSLLSLEGEYDHNQFLFDYDIVPDVLSPEPVTYGSSYNENYTKKRQLIYQGIQETFFNLDKDEKTRATAPIFFVIVISDIKKGIATKSTFYLPDLQAFITEAIPFEEYYLRELTDIFGDENLIGDKTGKNLEMTEVTWPAFLTDQIKNRIRFKFSHSDFPPKTDPDNEIISILANTLHFYPFQKFTTVYLYNLRERREMTFSPTQLKTFREAPDWERNKGKITVIRFPSSKNALGSSYSSGQDSDSQLPETEK